jgi:hypothetical protein
MPNSVALQITPQKTKSAPLTLKSPLFRKNSVQTVEDGPEVIHVEVNAASPIISAVIVADPISSKRPSETEIQCGCLSNP